ncbi:hypothetical protein CXG81DRAFT_25674 [Caulochytrium protostelioides]|uniref:EF-hand domain-containing protein n=1 Tax=Caulochytrium protostelioides TaxID=1555241 RepID=A0A4V1IUT1_9FUNG|nr:hypothetical protein CXG81DRAFT_25674 [Caulochytrium protostelioides]|eukprot:RKP01639.1 hypothetical protein CXG81DRAFT_25674 [Caulochytrium protostelioides]
MVFRPLRLASRRTQRLAALAGAGTLAAAATGGAVIVWARSADATATPDRAAAATAAPLAQLRARWHAWIAPPPVYADASALPRSSSSGGGEAPADGVRTTKPGSALAVHADEETDAADSPYVRWKKNRIGLYENRLRALSHPIKVFNYFATVTVDGETYMTVRDFIRSILPYRDNIHGHDALEAASAFFALADSNEDGLISFPEYMTFLTLLATPPYHWKLAFRLFDLDGNGQVTQSEFDRLMVRATSDLGVGKAMGSQEKASLAARNRGGHSGLYKLFFGADGAGVLTWDDFALFMRQLNRHILALEFSQLAPTHAAPRVGVSGEPLGAETATISMRDWALSQLHYAPAHKLPALLERVERISDAYPERVTFEQFCAFDSMIQTRLHDLGTAYRFYNAAGPGFTRSDFRRIIRAVAKLDLTPSQVDVIFTLFDDNGDGHLDFDEWYTIVLKGRQGRNLTACRDTGTVEYLKSVWRCVRQPEAV